MSKKTVEVKRRRRAEPPESGERERAAAPRRGAPQIPIGGLLQMLGGGKLSLPMILAIVGILVVCACLYIFVLGGPGLGGEVSVPAVSQPEVGIQATSTTGPTRTPRPFTPPAVSGEGGASWLVMLYQDADDKILEQDIYL
ncbi:MAG: hypothetical protein ACP5JJ_10745, partial [Anaerolineae bacterium]